MKCQVCQADLPPGSTFCTNCGTPVPANPYASSPNQGIAPTMLASSPTPPPDPYAPPPSDPYAASSNPYQVPPTAYGAPPPANPYGTPATPPANPYGTPAAPPPYGAPPAPGYNPVPGAYGQAPYIPQPPKKKGPNGCVIALIIVAVLFVLGIVGVVAAAAYGANKLNNIASNANATSTAIMATANTDLTPSTGNNGITPTTGTSGSVPSASQIDPTAQANITAAQTASGIDSNYKPTDTASTFNVGDTIYVTYTLAGKAGYVTIKTFDNSDGSLVNQASTPLKIDAGDSNGYFKFAGSTSGSYTSGLYWCQQSDCSDAALGQVVTFTIS